MTPNRHLWTSTCCALFLLVSSCQDSGNKGPTTAPPTVPAIDPATAPAAAEDDGEPVIFVLSPSSKLEWSGTRESEPLQGGFSNFTGKFEVSNGRLVSGGKHFVTIDMASVYTDKPEVTEILKSPAFFDTAKFPIARFQIQKATPVDGDKYDLTGILDLHGAARKITVPASLSVTGKETLLEMKAEFQLKTGDFGLGDAGAKLGDDIGMKVSLGAMPGEPKELVLMDKTQSAPTEQGPRRGSWGKGGFFGGDGKGGPGPDWRNMTEEEREKMRRERMAQIDTNKDGMIGKDELPPQAWEFMGRFDKNGDEKIDEDERKGMRAEFEARRQMRELSGEDGPGFAPPPGSGSPRGDGQRRGGENRGDSK